MCSHTNPSCDGGSQQASDPTISNTCINPELESAAIRTLTLITGSESVLKPLYLQPDRAVFLAENAGIVLKVYLEGDKLQHEFDVAKSIASTDVPTPQLLRFEAGQPAVMAMEQESVNLCLRIYQGPLKQLEDIFSISTISVLNLPLQVGSCIGMSSLPGGAMTKLRR